MNWLEPFRYGFMVDAVLIGSLVATVCAVLSCFLVLKGWSLMGDAISHAVLPGIVGAHLVGLPLALGAFSFVAFFLPLPFAALSPRSRTFTFEM